MKKRVFFAMNTVWADQCRASCRMEVEFGHSGSLWAPQHRRIAVCRVVTEPAKIVGLFHGKQVGPEEWELMNETLWSPPRDVASLHRFYRQLMSGEQPEIAWVSITDEQEACR